MKRTAPSRREQQRTFYVIALPVDLFARPPLLHYLVIVPLRKNRDFGVESAHVRVEQIVFVVATIIGKRRRDFAFFLSDDIAPGRPIRQLLLGGDCAVCIDAVAA